MPTERQLNIILESELEFKTFKQEPMSNKADTQLPAEVDKLNILKKHYYDYYRPSFPSDKRTAEVVNQALCIKEETEAIFKAMDDYATAYAIKLQEAQRELAEAKSLLRDVIKEVDDGELKLPFYSLVTPIKTFLDVAK